MAVGALIPFFFMLAAVYREMLSIVVKSSGCPGRFTVTAGTIRWKMRRSVIGVGRLIVIICMTTRAGVRCIVVIPVVAGGAIVCNGSMCAVQLVIIVVNCKCRGFPPGGGVASRTIRRDRERSVVRVGALIVIRRVASRTIGRSTGITVGVAVEAIGRLVLPCQREIGVVVVENIVFISCRMAGKACRAVVGISVHATVFVVRFRVFVAGGAGKFGVIRRIGMTIEALIPFAFVFTAVYREIRSVVLGVLGRHPVNVGGMAFYAILREVGCRMAGIYSRFVIRFVAGDTFGRQAGISSAGMALGAVGNIVALCQREKIVFYKTGSPVELAEIMAIGTIG